MSADDVFETKEFLQVVEASERAGAIVKDHVRAIVRAAEADAERIRARAEEDARSIRRDAIEAAQRILERIDVLEGPLGDLVTDLRSEADALTTDAEPESR